MAGSHKMHGEYVVYNVDRKTGGAPMHAPRMVPGGASEFKAFSTSVDSRKNEYC